MKEAEIKKLQDDNEFLRKEVERLKDELVRMVSRNLDLTERLEYDVELRRRTEVAREIIEGYSNVRTLQRRIQEVIGMSPVEYRLVLTKDLPT